jgi:hypothetical protein
MIVPRATPALILLTLALGACKKPEVQSYRVAKETAPAAAPAANATPPAAAPSAAPTMANTAVPTASGAALTWTAPSHWTSVAASAMRKATYAIKGDGASAAELTITAFPGDVGGDLANVNRWRGQIGLPAIAQADLATTTQHLDRNGLHITVVDLAAAGADAKGILGAIVPFDDGTWFFKLTGPAALVARERAAFTAFLDTIKPAAK